MYGVLFKLEMLNVLLLELPCCVKLHNYHFFLPSTIKLTNYDFRPGTFPEASLQYEVDHFTRTIMKWSCKRTIKSMLVSSIVGYPTKHFITMII